ncbi:MAG: Ig-like domain-containing protein, partial [Gemmatimonadota bacterium]|nr:Ig-like domain-containing protein [Gemmatimonadota bacterium]
MKRWSILALCALAACNDGTGPSEGGEVPSNVVITPGQARLVAVGDTMRLRAGLYSTFGSPLSAGAVTWTVADPDVFTIDQSGLVTGTRAPAVGRAIATIGGHADTAYVVVADPDASPCLGYSPPIALAVGQAMTVSLTDAACIASAGGGDEYIIVPWQGSMIGEATLTLEVTGSGLSTLPTPSASRSAGTRTVGGPVRSFEFERGLRELSRRELMPLARTARDAFTPRQTSEARGAAVPAYLAVGDLVRLNAAVSSACTLPSMRTGRVAAITSRAIVVHDTANPAGGFTDADYQRFAVTFDTLVAPVADAAFGAPTDIDVNGKVVIFFTRAVNELTPAGSGFFYGGFFHPRDLLPQTYFGEPFCPGSNEREMFYMLVPDPDGLVNGNARTAGFVDTLTIGTLAHEHQHLVNFARRVYVNGAFADEDVWLNEGLSHIAEELVFHRASGTAPRQNLGGERFGTQPYDELFTRYMAPNFGRLRVFLEDPQSSSPYSSYDDLGTRGAVWAFLRYAADRRGSGDGDVWMRLVNSTSFGFHNLADVFGPGVLQMMHDWSLSMYTDDHVPGVVATHVDPSWNFRTAYPARPAAAGPFPLVNA